MTEHRIGKRRLYIDETILMALGTEGEMRQAIQLMLKRLLQDEWIILSSAFAVSRLVGLEASAAAFYDYMQLIRRICAEIEPLEAADLERSSTEMVMHDCSLIAAIHLSLMKRMRCDGLLTLSPELRAKAPLPVFHPAEA